MLFLEDHGRLILGLPVGRACKCIAVMDGIVANDVVVSTGISGTTHTCGLALDLCEIFRRFEKGQNFAILWVVDGVPADFGRRVDTPRLSTRQLHKEVAPLLSFHLTP